MRMFVSIWFRNFYLLSKIKFWHIILSINSLRTSFLTCPINVFLCNWPSLMMAYMSQNMYEKYYETAVYDYIYKYLEETLSSNRIVTDWPVITLIPICEILLLTNSGINLTRILCFTANSSVITTITAGTNIDISFYNSPQVIPQMTRLTDFLTSPYVCN